MQKSFLNIEMCWIFCDDQEISFFENSKMETPGTFNYTINSKTIYQKAQYRPNINEFTKNKTFYLELDQSLFPQNIQNSAIHTLRQSSKFSRNIHIQFSKKLFKILQLFFPIKIKVESRNLLQCTLILRLRLLAQLKTSTNKTQSNFNEKHFYIAM